MTHICVGKVTNIGSDNCLWPGLHQATIWANAGKLWTLKNILQRNVNRNSNICIEEYVENRRLDLSRLGETVRYDYPSKPLLQRQFSATVIEVMAWKSKKYITYETTDTITQICIKLSKTLNGPQTFLRSWYLHYIFHTYNLYSSYSEAWEQQQWQDVPSHSKLPQSYKYTGWFQSLFRHACPVEVNYFLRISVS